MIESMFAYQVKDLLGFIIPLVIALGAVLGGIWLISLFENQGF